jgi:hypothetical protein
MDLLLEHDNAIRNLGMAVCAIWAAYTCVRDRSILGMVLWVPLGAAFTVLGLLDLLGVGPRPWMGIATNAVVGIGFMMAGTADLYVRFEPEVPRWIV